MVNRRPVRRKTSPRKLSQSFRKHCASPCTISVHTEPPCVSMRANAHMPRPSPLLNRDRQGADPRPYRFAAQSAVNKCSNHRRIGEEGARGRGGQPDVTPSHSNPKCQTAPSPSHDLARRGRLFHAFCDNRSRPTHARGKIDDSSVIDMARKYQSNWKVAIKLFHNSAKTFKGTEQSASFT
jgi:hypothetical protein